MMKRGNYTAQVVAFFKEHPGEMIPIKEIQGQVNFKNLSSISACISTLRAKGFPLEVPVRGVYVYMPNGEATSVAGEKPETTSVAEEKPVLIAATSIKTMELVAETKEGDRILLDHEGYVWRAKPL